MNALQLESERHKELCLELTRLIGKKELSFGCLFIGILEDVGYNANGGNGGGYGGETCYAMLRYTSQDNYNVFVTNLIHTFKDQEDYENGKGEYVDVGGTDELDWISPDIEQGEIIGHPATLSDFHRWMDGIRCVWEQKVNIIKIKNWGNVYIEIPYDSSKDLLDQETSTLEQIISLITSNK